MACNIAKLKAFYSSPAGQASERFIAPLIWARWQEDKEVRGIALGYAEPYLIRFFESRNQARFLNFLPAEGKVETYVTAGLVGGALIDGEQFPLSDSCMDRVLVVHALESCRDPKKLLTELWRILVPGGRALIIVPNRNGFWARSDQTPFGEGRPFSKSQLRYLLGDQLLLPIYWAEALYMPPSVAGASPTLASLWEYIGHSLAIPVAGVYIVEVLKQLYRPVSLPQLIHEPTFSTLRPELAFSTFPNCHPPS